MRLTRGTKTHKAQTQGERPAKIKARGESWQKKAGLVKDDNWQERIGLTTGWKIDPTSKPAVHVSKSASKSGTPSESAASRAPDGYDPLAGNNNPAAVGFDDITGTCRPTQDTGPDSVSDDFYDTRVDDGPDGTGGGDGYCG